MTDQQRFTDFLDSIDLKYDLNHDEHRSVITINARSGKNIEGYAGFLCDWTFNSSGKFVKVGIWE